MANDFDAVIEGTDNLEQIFEKLPNQFNRKIMYKVFRKAAQPVVRGIRSNTPVRQRIKAVRGGTRIVKGNATSAIRFPGNLKKSIGTIAGNGKYPTLYIGPKMGAKFKNDGWYGKFLINGTKNIKPNPFVQNTWEQTQNKAEEIIDQDSGKLARDFLKKYAAK